MIEPAWEHYPHEADIGVRGIAASRETAFEQAALAMMAVITTPDTVEPVQRVGITCKAPDDELLLADWLNALVYEMATRKMLFSRFEVRISDHSLEAYAWGEPVDPGRHQRVVEVKGATYTDLKVRRHGEQHWIAQCVVDV